MGWIADLLKEIPSAARYKAELEAMEKENNSLRAEVEALRSELKSYKPAEGSLIPDVEKILIVIGRHEYITAAQVAHSLSLSKGLVEMHLEDLMTAQHIDASYAMGQETEYYLKQSGRRYLHAKGLL
jgi:uncharacterized protein YgbK (DUF1537 family)